MIKTIYHPVSELTDDWANFPFFNNRIGIAKRQVLNVPPSVKVTLTILATIVGAALLWIGSGLLIITIPVLIMSIMSGRLIWGCIHQTLPAVSRKLVVWDEVMSLTHTYKKLLSLKSMLPEGTGYAERIDEFGRLSFRLMEECSRLPNMNGRSKNFHALQNEIQTKMTNLLGSGNELADLIASRRAENTLESIRHLGVDEYIEHVSLETMSYRALTAGGDDDPKVIKPRPDATPPYLLPGVKKGVV